MKINAAGGGSSPEHCVSFRSGESRARGETDLRRVGNGVGLRVFVAGRIEIDAAGGGAGPEERVKVAVGEVGRANLIRSADASCL